MKHFAWFGENHRYPIRATDLFRKVQVNNLIDRLEGIGR